MIFKYPIIFCFIFSLGNSQTSNAQTFEIKEQDGGILLLENRSPVFFYQVEPKSLNDQYERSNYLHPIYSIDGLPMTEDFPADHLHHRGIFWTWHEIIVNGTKVADGWDCSGIEWDVHYSGSQILDSGGIEMTFDTKWHVNAIPDAICEEEVLITAHQSSQQYRILDFENTLTSRIDDLQIAGSQDEKGYGGFSARIKMPDDLTFLSKQGEVIPQVNQVAAGPWINMEGHITESDSSEGIVIMDHPNNPMNEHLWILRRKGSMQNIVFPGNELFQLEQDIPLKLKYRLVVYKGQLNINEIEEIYRDWKE